MFTLLQNFKKKLKFFKKLFFLTDLAKECDFLGSETVSFMYATEFQDIEHFLFFFKKKSHFGAQHEWNIYFPTCIFFS